MALEWPRLNLSFDQFKGLSDNKILIDDEAEAREFLQQFQLASK